MLSHCRGRRFCRSSTVSALRHKALLIGINYASSSDDNEQGYRPLKGPINDAKEVQEALIGEVQSTALPLTCSTRLLLDVFNYKKEDICLMTDEEANRDTALWPSQANIVSLGFPYGRALYHCPFPRLPITI